MKLLIISHPCVTSVNQQFYAEVERQKNWKLTIVAPSNWKNEYGNQINPKRWHEYQGELLTIPIWKSGSIPLHTYRALFISLLKELQPDAIYVHHEPYAAATAQIYLANLMSIKAAIGFYSAQNIFKSYPIPFKQLENWVLQTSQFAFPVSQSVERVLKEKNYQNLSTVLPLAIDPTLYTPNLQSSKLADQWRTRDDEVILGYLGRIVREKGLRTLLLALSRILDLPWKLVMVGSGAYEIELKAFAEELRLNHRIMFLGYVPHLDAPRYLSAFDALIIPSETQPNWKEQFGRVIIEAIACGTPVIGSNSGEIPYLIKATGGGLVFPEGEPEPLANQLSQLICNAELRTNLASQGQRIVLENYTTSSIAQRFTQTVELAVESKAAV